MKKQYYTKRELWQLAAVAMCFEELKNISLALKYLWALNEEIDLDYFEKCAHKRLHEIF